MKNLYKHKRTRGKKNKEEARASQKLNAMLQQTPNPSQQ